MLDAENRSLGNTIVSAGAPLEGLRPRRLFQPIILHDAPRFIVMVNHASGDPEPTEADHHLIKKLDLYGRSILDSELLDYIVVGGKQYWSLSVSRGRSGTCQRL